MTPLQWQRVTALFDEARARPGSERAAFVAREAADDPVVCAEVLSLLEADRDDAFLERGAVVQPADLLDEAGGHTFEPGASLGPYRIERLLARGGMGVLYVGIDTRLGRRVTLKVLPTSTARDPRARARLQREARTAAQLRHPHIVSVHALEELGNTLVIVAEFVEGPTLAETLRDEGPLDRERWLALARSLASALAAAHAALVIHRDVKSSNIVLGADGLRLVDFGIALAQADGGDTRLTRAGQSAGTPLAQAPEQLEGGPATALSDQFAFGLVLYEAASGRWPYGDGPLASVWARMLRDEPLPLSAVAPQLSVDDVVIVHRCLARRPEDRFPSMQAVVTALVAPGADAARTAGVPAPEGRVRRTGPTMADAPSRDATTAVESDGLVHRSAQRSEQRDDGLVHRSAQRSERRDDGLVHRSAQRNERREGGWWDVHQAVTAALYIGLLWPGWLVVTTLPGRWRAMGHIALVCLAAIATSLRLHLWFSARHYPHPVAALRRRWWPVSTAIDVIYAGLLGALALAAADVRIVPAVVTAGLAVCLLMASLVIEPATRRATHLDDDR